MQEYLNKLLAGSASFAIMASLSVAAAAQDEDEACTDDNGVEVECVEDAEEIIITGSRLKRTEFTSATPIQVIDGQVSRELGLFDAAEIMQTATQSTGQQIDNSFVGFVLDNGLGSSTIGFRGLGSGRTLVMVNGRRLAPAGIGGAPVSPDLNLIPSIMIQRVENVFDGASTIYGSDAIAGVSNVILKKNVEGFDIQTSYRTPEGGGGEELTTGIMWGKQFDRGSITIGGEFYDRKQMSYADSAFHNGCQLRLYEDENGNRLDPQYGGLGGPRPTQGTEFEGCDIFPLTNRMQINNTFGSVYYSPGNSNIGIDDWLETTSSSGYIFFAPDTAYYDSNSSGVLGDGDRVYWDGNGDGLMDVDLQDPFYAYELTDYSNQRDFITPLRRYNAMVSGEYIIDEDSETTFFFDAFYSRRENKVFSPGAQIFEWHSPLQPFNPCNNAMDDNGTPGDPSDDFAINPTGQNCHALFGIDLGPQWVRPIVNIRGDRDSHTADIYQYRMLGGLTGTFDLFSKGWDWEAYASYSYSSGWDRRRGVLDARLLQAMDSRRLADGSVVCNDTSNGCVPFNFFQPRILAEGGGTLTPEEDAFLMGDRTIQTEIKQTMFGGSVTGDLFNLPWNDLPVPVFLGVEHRKDTIISDPNDVASEGLLWGYFSDKGANGSRSIKEAFIETRFDIAKDLPMAERMSIEAAARITDETFYDAAWTYSVKGFYQPTEFLTFRGTHGTSYRAPNLRERFIAGTSGFGTITDPCWVPESARITDPTDPTAPQIYDAANDQRVVDSPWIMTSCSANGIDPTSHGLQSNSGAGASTEISRGGTGDLDEERSTSSTYGFVIEQPFTEAFELKYSMTWFEIEVVDAVVEPSGQYLVNQCFNNEEVPDGSSQFCGRLQRGGPDNRITQVSTSFINRGRETARGIDYNVFFSTDFQMGNQDFDLSIDVRATQMKEQIVEQITSQDDNVGETDVPTWRGFGRATLAFDEFRVSWQTRFVGAGREDNADGPFSELGTGCIDMPGVSCRRILYTDDYWVHNASVSWTDGRYSATLGARNLFNTAPPLVDFGSRNIPRGAGYDTAGRSFFGVLGIKF